MRYVHSRLRLRVRVCGAVGVRLTWKLSCFRGSGEVLHGLLDLPVADKMSLEAKCNFEWPCFGEA